MPAGNEVFDAELVRRYVADTVAVCGFAWDDFAALALVPAYGSGFGMTPYALRTSAHANGVSELHGAVSRRMWAALWPERPAEDAPIEHVTNGVHARTWLAAELEQLLREHGVRPDAPPGEQKWGRVVDVPDEDLWRVHGERKRALIELVRRRHGDEIADALDPDALTIGFARRFATYKRAGLLFRDPDRLAALLGSVDRPLQVVFAGKAHPADDGGKTLMQQLVGFTRDPRSGGRVVFLEDYDMELARTLLQGVDVWLNTPRRPQEACGTSGMKAALNGVLNVSILDGWWAEGYAPEVGWAIGGTHVDPHEAEQDAPRRRRSVPAARGGDRADVLPARRRRASARLAEADERVDRAPRLGVQRAADGRRVRRGHVPARAPQHARVTGLRAAGGRRRDRHHDPEDQDRPHAELDRARHPF